MFNNITVFTQIKYHSCKILKLNMKLCEYILFLAIEVQVYCEENRSQIFLTLVKTKMNMK